MKRAGTVLAGAVAAIVALGAALAVMITILNNHVENRPFSHEQELRVAARQAGKPIYWLGPEAPLSDVPATSDGAEIVPQSSRPATCALTSW